MSKYQSKFLQDLEPRGFIHQGTDLEGLDKELISGPKRAYIGFDCTAPSLHVGNLTQIMLLRRFQQAGHQPIVLLGGGTTRIGDPSGKDSSRKMLTDDQINANIAGIRDCFSQFLSFGDGPTDALMVNNADWLSELGYIDFLRDIGPHFTINRMLTFDSVKLRLDREQPLTFLEFNYMILQAYDFAELSKRHDCILQLGGSDQWGNIVNGIELARRTLGQSLYGVTSPLITTADGKKMGKTEAGAVWLNEAQLSHYDYWQFWRNTQDADVGRFLRLFTDLSLEEIKDLEALEGADINQAKITLATLATTMARSGEAALAAEKTATETFVKGGVGEDLPTLEISSEDAASQPMLVDLFVELGMAKSKGEIRRLIKGGGARLNDKKITAEDATLTPNAIATGEAKLSAGKKRHAIVRVIN